MRAIKKKEYNSFMEKSLVSSSRLKLGWRLLNLLHRPKLRNMKLYLP